ncbi:DNA topoisomerase III [Paraglaciecola hydrolytica]|uniref:DNA topoisomerase 3 n=1 Tax=Paraglaciecola hydrolytica TaxID=1799789 RepID=A0A136A5P0_9ALTE|nr:DNA topoisomerase III [Paraglaciecola hydrolytica]KXI30562.1 DNA topoisomerase III [Paraglaciecola hydrolytica]
MIVYIAEKPSLGRAIAQAFGGQQQKRDGYIELANGDCVTWCIGHLLEQAEPDKYDPAFAKWALQHLPIVPTKWQLVPKKNTQKQLTVVKRLLKTASHIVNAGDPDREGQLLVDEVITYCGVKAALIESAGRLLINDLNTSAVQKALQNMRSNKEFVGLSTSALARSRADWLYGLNLTRAYTLLGQRGGYSGVLSVGRVQTPVLGLVVRRDQEIANFVSKPFFEVIATLETQQKVSFSAKWQPSEACEPYQDEEGRVLSRKLAQTVVDKTRGQPALVKDYKAQSKQSPPPLPYSLSALQIDGSKRFNLSPKAVLDICQSLYENHQLITYPRSDSRYLPKEHFSQARSVLNAIKNNVPSYAGAVEKANPALKSKAWDDSKVDAHHAIIPTTRTRAVASLRGDEAKIYQLIANQYLMQFYGPHQYQEQIAKIDIAGGVFIAKGKTTLELGWLALTIRDNNKVEMVLPTLTKGEPLQCIDSQLVEKQTSAPKHFTDATLLAAMTGIARYVQDSEIKKILKDTDGLGTEATRASIIDLLFKRQFMQKVGKEIHATDTGKALINALPSETTHPDMTAIWESNLDKISQRQMRYEAFMQPLTESITQLIKGSQQLDTSQFAGLARAKPAGKKRFYKKKS